MTSPALQPGALCARPELSGAPGEAWGIALRPPGHAPASLSRATTGRPGQDRGQSPGHRWGRMRTRAPVAFFGLAGALVALFGLAGATAAVGAAAGFQRPRFAS